MVDAAAGGAAGDDAEAAALRHAGVSPAEYAVATADGTRSAVFSGGGDSRFDRDGCGSQWRCAAGTRRRVATGSGPDSFPAGAADSHSGTRGGADGSGTGGSGGGAGAK